MSEVIVSFNGSGGIHDETAKELHPNNRVDEEQHPHQHADVGKSLIKTHPYSANYFYNLL